MQKSVASRPSTFRTVQDAIEYSVGKNQPRSRRSALLSVPPLLHHTATDRQEEGVYTWVTDVGQTVEYWDHWFRGLSKTFLSLSCAKLLVLAGTHPLIT